MSKAAERLQNLQARIGVRTGLRAEVTGQETQADGPDGTHAELWLYGVVGGYWFGFNAKSVGDQLRGLNVDRITVRLHSPGGSVFDGIAIANLLRNHKASVTVVVDGLAASSASIIALAGDDIVMSPGSQLMLHDAWTVVAGNEKELRQEADWIGKQAQNLAEQYAARAGGTAEEWRAVMTAEPDGTWYTAQEAVDAKLADRVGTVTAISAAPEPPADLDDEDDETNARAAWDLDVLVHPAARAAWTGGARGPKPPSASAVGSIHTEGGSAVAFSDEQMTNLRGTLGLPETADEAAIVAAVNAVVEDSLEEPGAPTAPQVPEGMALVDSGVLAQLQAGATAGQAAADTLAKQEREAAFADALRAGKLSADTAKTLRAQVEEKPETWAATKALLDALTPGLIPTAEVGHGGEPDAEKITVDDAELAAFAGQLGLTKEALRG